MVTISLFVLHMMELKKNGETYKYFSKQNLHTTFEPGVSCVVKTGVTDDCGIGSRIVPDPLGVETNGTCACALTLGDDVAPFVFFELEV